MSDKLKYTHIGLYIYHSLSLAMSVMITLGVVLCMGTGMLASMAEDDPDAPPAWFWGILTIFMFVFALFSMIVPIVGLWAIKKRTQWAWVLQIIFVAFGFGSGLTLVPCVFLFLGLISEEVQEYYKHPETVIQAS